MTTRVLLASEVDATKLVGAASRDVNSGAGAGSSFAAPATGADVVFGTRRNDEHAATLNTKSARQIDDFREFVAMSCTSGIVTQKREQGNPREVSMSAITAGATSDYRTGTKITARTGRGDLACAYRRSPGDRG
jgi:hypothetical protein